MKKADGHMSYEVRRICRDIYSHRDQLQTLVVRLQEVLRRDAQTVEPYDTRAQEGTKKSDDPFDKIMVV
jgi:hypothetical protein